MTTLKRNLIIATGIYILFYLAPIIANPFTTLNLLEAFLIGILVFGVSYLNYIFTYTGKSTLNERTKSTIITSCILLIALLIFFNPIQFPIVFNVVINKYIAIILLLLILLFIILLARKMDNSIILILLFAPSIIQGLLMRLSYKAMLFYVTNPNINLYLTIAIFIGYYIYNNKK
ncbi:hypothetical protein [uncultured Gemella sp.]|uniref:hypothetical protein n=1 Tax=uncultured Gemella sp. TaxID=254352 RepID=UPI0028D65A1A|nr:hypothetical protein [uncultured Gemella sp.]